MSLPKELAVGGARALHGRLRLPGDKSISHRALLFAALATGRSKLTNLATGLPRSAYPSGSVRTP